MRTFSKLPSDYSVRELTDEQWLWLYANMIVDTDETLEGMCHKCRGEATSRNNCTRCGKSLSHGESFINPNFDPERFERLSQEGDAVVENSNFDTGEYRMRDGG